MSTQSPNDASVCFAQDKGLLHSPFHAFRSHGLLEPVNKYPGYKAYLKYIRNEDNKFQPTWWDGGPELADGGYTKLGRVKGKKSSRRTAKRSKPTVYVGTGSWEDPFDLTMDEFVKYAEEFDSEGLIDCGTAKSGGEHVGRKAGPS